VPELALELYRGSPPAVLRLAEMQIRSGLQKLQREGRATPDDKDDEEGWRLTES
jgi:hypothetical protein